MSSFLFRRVWCRPAALYTRRPVTPTTLNRHRPPYPCRIHSYTSSAKGPTSAEHPPESPLTDQLDALLSGNQYEQLSGPNKQKIYDTFAQHTADGGAVPDHLGYYIVSVLLTPRFPGDAEFPDQVPDADKELALRVLDFLSLQGTPVLTMGVFAMLYQAAAFSPPQPSTGTSDTTTTTATNSSKDDLRNNATLRISRIINALHLPYHPDDARTLMTMLFQNEDYESFWKLWRRIPLRGEPRIAEDYLMLFNLHAKLSDQRRVEECVLTWFPMMEREDVSFEALDGEIARAVARCILVVEPYMWQKRAGGETMGLLGKIWDFVVDLVKPELLGGRWRSVR
ncbi:uncharacterized protein BP01DRAFT_360217 [Aspergillus saccharolyticus JOP 1030-1]|uniref:ATPase synthesis protein 25 n=1 Tax=Aspergillus saccharolyticus JOP 1030-1 TaxID=1450539 RepID=A0A318Z2S2_9EURO|nr:hypothetical protein BP01DRAFT_360217 [Aspergillus saccharolyticus JOP 1030-1]PYH41565.1 hypothetical protein BP01DRAFT_360217 [Aspergillus saccharolyticus JOP 1030-1]